MARKQRKRGSEPPCELDGEPAPVGASGRVAALDLGKARVGLAVSDELGMLAHPRDTLDARREPKLLRDLAALAKDERIVRFVVGYPLHLDGRQGVAAERAARFCQKLADAAGVAIELVDERLTSVQAERQLREAGASRAQVRAKVDAASAVLILQLWLDQRGAD